tara:strand:- start:760 stop:1935 length:1176 start_codon:yes stop_codon:yes gene_type:complete
MGMIEISDLSVLRGSNKVLDGFSLTVNEGEVVCLAGENGCGKSTVIEAAAGLISLENGTSRISGQLIRDSEGRRGRTKFGLCLQDDCVMGDELVGERIMDAAEFNFDVSAFLDDWNLKHRTHDRIAVLSGGQRRKVAVMSGIIPALVSKEPVAVLLDEPDSGLDSNSIEHLSQCLRNLAAGGHAILIASHEPMIIDSADRVVYFPFDEEKNTPPAGKFEQVKTISQRKPMVGHRLNLRTLSGFANNGIAGLLTLGAMIALFDAPNLDGRTQLGFIMAPALAAGLCGNPINRLLMENRSHAWWITKSGILPNSIFHSLILYILLTLLSSITTDYTDMTVILVGGILGIFTEITMAIMTQATLRLSRPNAVIIKLLTPILILPWAIVVDNLAT